MINPLSLRKDTVNVLNQLVGKTYDANSSEDHEEQPADDAEERNHADEDGNWDRKNIRHAGGRFRSSNFLLGQDVRQRRLVFPGKNYVRANR